MSELDENEVAAAPDVETEVNNSPTAIRKVLRNAMVVDGCIRGLHEVAKYVDAGKAQVVFLAEPCNEPTYNRQYNRQYNSNSIGNSIGNTIDSTIEKMNIKINPNMFFNKCGPYGPQGPWALC